MGDGKETSANLLIIVVFSFLVVILFLFFWFINIHAYILCGLSLSFARTAISGVGDRGGSPRRKKRKRVNNE